MAESPRLPWRTVAVATVLGLLAAGATVVLLSDDADEATTPITLVPEDEVPTFDGTEVPLTSVRGTPTVVNFFASYCVPCITEMPEFEEVYQDVDDGAVAFLGLAVSDRTEDAEALVQQTGVTYPTAEDKDASVITVLEGAVLPTTVLLDAQGQVVAQHSGELTADELRELIAEELGVSL